MAPKRPLKAYDADPPARSLTPQDRVNSFTHLLDTAQQHARHAGVHSVEAARQASTLPTKGRTATIQYNARHAAGHDAEAATTLERAIGKLRQSWPNAKAALDELGAPPRGATRSVSRGGGRKGR